MLGTFLRAGINKFEISIKFCIFLIPILIFFKKKNFCVIIALFAILNCKCEKTIHSQSVQKVLIRAKKIFIKKFNMGIKKRRISRWFRIRWKSLEKSTQKNLLAKTWGKYALFSLLLMFVKLALLVTFFWCIFLQLFQRIWNQREILRFFISFLIFVKKNFFGSY